VHCNLFNRFSIEFSLLNWLLADEDFGWWPFASRRNLDFALRRRISRGFA
jgi:hypothetical protein